MDIRKLLVITSAASAAFVLGGLAPAGARTLVPHPAGTTRGGAVASCAITGNVYSESRSLLTACGYHFLARAAVRVLPGGGKAYIYDQNGHQITFAVPPKGFDVLSATKAQLREYNLPAWTSWGSKRTWDRIMRKVRFTAPPTALIEGPARNSVACDPNSTGQCWAGYIAAGRSNYDAASAQYIEPHIGSTVCSGPLAEALWVGLGGFNGNNNVLGQDGTAYGGGDPHGPWWEVLPLNAVYPEHWDASPGDTISAKVLWDPTASKYVFTVIDGNNEMNLTESGTYNGTSAEFILEDPVVNGVRTELENVGTVPWSDAYAAYGTSPSKKLGTFQPESLTSQNLNTANVLAESGSIGSDNDSFKVTQEHCK